MFPRHPSITVLLLSEAKFHAVGDVPTFNFVNMVCFRWRNYYLGALQISTFLIGAS